jgi:SAM-dependent methyltransferase
MNDLYAKEAHKNASLEGCAPAIERQQILAKLLQPNGLLLDVGCWNGSFSQYLHGIKYIGVDINRQALEQAKLKKIGVVLASCDFLPFRSELFDACSMIEVIEHLYFPDKAVREAHRVLKQNGKLILATPNFVNFIDRINVLIGKNIIQMGHQHIRFFTWKTLNDFLRRHGFELEVRKTWFLPFPARRVTKKYPSWRKLMRLAGKLFPNLDEGLLGRWRRISEENTVTNEPS